MSVFKHFLMWKVGLARAETQTTEAERDCLAQYAAGKQILIEVGVWHGVTTRRLRAAMAPDAILYAIDPYPVGRLGFSVQRGIAQAEVGKVKNGQVKWIRTKGVEAAGQLSGELTRNVEFAFIDGDHSYDGLKGDWEAWSGLIAKTGIVALHDSRSSPSRPIDDAGSVMFTQEVIRRDPRYECVAEIDSLTVVRKIQ